ncbi:cytochrome P450 [Lindgomyces ingoldianus]|uniref:Cytochrome P450 n=1 Tax=Lindgomyces ingoldianus TaxID=673940 RepID=A0ACB6QYU4_9PLEO|nr:cytochrome P450 [Lindgomyces ingoldianus]KAF2472168.1 cytochrome P450 [Lindgomyces ingoldianus]
MTFEPVTTNLAVLNLSFLLHPLDTLPITAPLSYAIYQGCFSPLSNTPGPFLASLTRWWLAKLSVAGNYNTFMASLHNKEVSIADLTDIKQIYGFGSRFQESDWYGVWRGHRKFNVFGGQDMQVHALQRKLVARAYALESLEDLEPYVDRSIEVFMRKMHEQLDQEINMAEWAQLSLLTMEPSLLSQLTWLGQVPWLFWLYGLLIPYIGNYLGVNMRHGPLRDYALKAAAERQKWLAEKRDMIGRFFETSATKPEEFDYNAIVSMGTTNITAGSDTTAVSTRAIIYHLLKNRTVKQKLLEEIDELRRKGELGDPVRFDKANKMTYLQAIMQEGLCMHPAVGMNLPRVVPLGGTEINGHYFPEGSVLGVIAWVVHQNKDVYGEDADQFRPERWLKKDAHDMRKSNCKYRFFSFGGGSRSCIGKNIS